MGLSVRSHKSHKIDLNAEYPCPCRRRGQICPIVLTEAFGCDRCQQIFVVRDSGYAIEQLSTHYPYKRAWRWTGQQWLVNRSAVASHYVPLLLMSLFGVTIFILLLMTLQPPAGAGLASRVVAALFISTLLVLMFWLACRR